MDNNALVIGAHMDDPEMGCGGTIPILKRLGYEVYELILTDGSGGGDTEVRMKESMAAAEVLGIKDVYFGKQEDTKLPYSEATQIIEKYVKELKPRLVITNSEHDKHPDHRTSGLATASAIRTHRMPYVHEILMYELPHTVTSRFDPHKFYDISHTIKLKLKSLKEHRSQINRGSINPNIAIIKAKSRGVDVGASYVEAFELNHLFVTLDDATYV
jgi:LmbE family N-acetylglucosaminyl deacetylase